MRTQCCLLVVFLFGLLCCYGNGNGSLSFPQTNSINDTLNKNFSTLAIKPLFENRAYKIEEIIFQRKNSERTYTVTLPTVDEITFKNKKWGEKLVPKPSMWKRIAPIITHMDTSMITVRFHPRMNRAQAKEFNEVVQELKRSKAFTREEKEYKYFMLAYPDSALVPMDSVKKMRFSRFNSRKKHFYSDIRAGFNEQRNPELATGIFRSVTIIVGVYVLASVSAAHFPIAFAIVATKVLVWDLAGYLVSTKGINFKRWKPQAA